MTARKKEDFLRDAVEHIDITQFPDVVPLVEAMGRQLSRPVTLPAPPAFTTGCWLTKTAPSFSAWPAR